MKRKLSLVILCGMMFSLFSKITLNLITDSGNCLDSKCIYSYYNSEEATISLIGSTTVTTDYGSEYADYGAKATYKGLDVSEHLQVRTDLNVFKSGTYTYEYYIILSGTEYSVEREVNVTKDHGITFTLLGSKKVSIEYGSPYVDAGCSAVDKETGEDISYLINTKNEVNTSIPGTYLVYYHFYYNGQRRVATREVEVKNFDNYTFELINPDVEVLGRAEANRYNTQSNLVAWNNATNKDISGFVEIVSDLKRETEGEFTITYTLNYMGIEQIINKTIIVDWLA